MLERSIPALSKTGLLLSHLRCDFAWLITGFLTSRPLVPLTWLGSSLSLGTLAASLWLFMKTFYQMFFLSFTATTVILTIKVGLMWFELQTKLLASWVETFLELEILWILILCSSHLLQRKPGVPIGFKDGRPLARYWRSFRFFYSDASIFYVLSWWCWERERLLLLKPQIHIKIVSPVWEQYGSNLDNLWLLGDNNKEGKVASGYRNSSPGP